MKIRKAGSRAYSIGKQLRLVPVSASQLVLGAQKFRLVDGARVIGAPCTRDFEVIGGVLSRRRNFSSPGLCPEP